MGLLLVGFPLLLLDALPVAREDLLPGLDFLQLFLLFKLLQGSFLLAVQIIFLYVLLFLLSLLNDRLKPLLIFMLVLCFIVLYPVVKLDSRFVCPL